MSWFGEIVGPRRVGGVYMSGYWRQPYVTLGVSINDESGEAFLLEMSRDDYRPRLHCTAWEEGRDSVIHQPSDSELMAFGHSQLRKHSRF